MGPKLRTSARFPEIAGSSGHYESFYVKANDPAGGRALWLRHTLHRRPGEPLTAALWLTLFDAAATPRATKQSFGEADVSTPSGAYLKIADAALEPGRARGSIAGASWDLRFDDGAGVLRHLQPELLYRTRLPRTKLLSPNPMSSFAGFVELGGKRLELEGWPGMVGHNWGSEHAARWIWMQAANLGGSAADYLDIALGRVRLAGRMSPWIANGRIVIDGESHRVGGLQNAYGTRVEESATGCEFEIPGKKINVKGRIGADPSRFVGWLYADPRGGEHHALNCSIADLELRVERPDHKHAKLSCEGTAVYELGTTDPGHEIEIQPYGDG